jgi:hypothetical protein
MKKTNFFQKTSVSVRVKAGGLIESKGGGEAPDRVWGFKDTFQFYGDRTLKMIVLTTKKVLRRCYL